MASENAAPSAPTPNQAHGCARRRRWRDSSENHAFRSKPPARVAGRPSRRFYMPSQERQPCEARLERVMGIEPTLVAWEATVLPLNYTRARTDSMQGMWRTARTAPIVEA